MVSETAKPSKIHEGAPTYSDVCLSSRWERPRNESDTFDTFKATETFFATRLNWVYTTNPDFIKKAKDRDLKIQIALTPTLPDLPFGTTTRELGRIRDSLGNFATAPWMKNWNTWWGCVNNPDFQHIYWENIRTALDAGAHDFQVDDPGFAEVLNRNEWERVCFCEFCKEKAKKAGVSAMEIQKESVLEFHQNVKAKASEYAGREVAFSCNNFRGDWELFPHDFFDYGIAEAPIRRGNPEYIYAAVRETRRRGKAQILSFVSDKTWLVQKVIASTYASGGNLLVPWDVWQGGGKPRYFGKAEDYANYYGFVRAISGFLEGYEDAFYHNSQTDPRYLDFEKMPLYFSEYRRNFHAYVRAKPNEKDTPVVIHLVDWEIPNADSTEIIVNENYFFEKGIGKIELIQPIEFDKEKFSQNPDYQQFKSSSDLNFITENQKIKLTIPKLEMHWAVLIINPD